MMAQQLAEQSFDRNDPIGWFEQLYNLAQGDKSAIPWTNLKVNPNLDSWLRKG